MTNAEADLGQLVPSFSFSLLNSTATIICRCGGRIDGTILTVGSYLPSDGWNDATEGDPVELDCETDCPVCGANLWPTVETACRAIWRDAHRR